MHHRPDLYTRWSLEMRRKEFFHAGQRVGVAVSGGPDSVLLLHFMQKLARECGLTLAVVHFNHHLRGAESDGDEALVRDLATSLQIEYLRGEAEVGRVARERRRNLEAVARELRYRFFFSLVDQGRLDRVATAHTANDQAETVLMRLLRGTGTRGLGGIYPVLEGKVVRPFLGLTRAEVMQEIAARQTPLPGGFLEPQRPPATEQSPHGVAARCWRKSTTRKLSPSSISSPTAPATKKPAWSACARDRAHPWRVREGKEERISIRALLELPPALARRVLRQMLQMVRGSSHGLTYAHIESLRRFAAEAQSGKMLTLPGGALARKEFAWLVVGPVASEPAGGEYSYLVTIPGELAVRELACTFRFKILSRDDPGKAYNVNKLNGLDPQKLGGELVLRNWRAGDGFCPSGSGEVRKLKELFRERKIPGVRRNAWPVLLCAGQIVWVRGFPPAKGVAATDQTPRVLIVEEELTRPSPAAREKAI